MKKLLSLLFICTFAASLVGCSENAKETGGKASDELSSATEETQPEETLESRTREIDTENAYVFDESVILSDGEYDALNTYTAWLSKTFKINAAIVLTDDIGESEPADYARNFYESNYSGDKQ